MVKRGSDMERDRSKVTHQVTISTGLEWSPQIVFWKAWFLLSREAQTGTNASSLGEDDRLLIAKGRAESGMELSVSQGLLQCPPVSSPSLLQREGKLPQLGMAFCYHHPG